jgi:hypothetical protein
MYVSSTADQGVVGADTRIRFVQKGSRVLGRYAGGAVRRGCLVGTLSEGVLGFRFAQLEASGELHAGRSQCEVLEIATGRLRIVEHFRWTTRDGQGVNVFDECPES